MKILILADGWLPDDWGGASVIALNNAIGLKKAGVDVLVVTTTQDNKKAGKFEYKGIEGERIYTNYNERWRAYLSLYNPWTVKKVKKIIDNFKPDIVQAHNIHFYLSYACLKVAKASGAKVFLTAHDVMMFNYGKLTNNKYIESDNLSVRSEFDYKVDWKDRFKQAKKRFNPFREVIIRNYLKYVDKIFTVSRALREALDQNGIINTKVLHNGIDMEEWIGEGGDEFKVKNNLEDKRLIMFGGRLSEAKGISQAFELLARIKKEVPEIVLVIFGDEEKNRKIMNELTWKLGLGENIFYAGILKRNELKSVYEAVEVVLVPSICFDSLPTVILEAMVMRKPVIATHFGGAREMVDNEETGYIVNPFNIEDMSNKVMTLLKDKDKAIKMGEKGRKKVEREFSLGVYIERLINLYRV